MKKEQFYLVCYDIADEKRLRRVARIMEDFGLRVLYSIFECRLKREEFKAMKAAVEEILDPLEDKVRYYVLCDHCKRSLIHLGYGKNRNRLQEKELIL